MTRRVGGRSNKAWAGRQSSEVFREGLIHLRTWSHIMEDATVLVIGSGGREHALCLALTQSTRVGSIHCSPGNAGTALLGVNHRLENNATSTIISLAKKLNTDLIVVGPEAPLCEGLADACAEQGLACFGPVAALAHLEGSKLHAKQTMRAAGVPTADFQTLDEASNIEAALDAYAGQPWVVKRNVLAGGKGVVVTSDRSEAKDFIESSIALDGMVILEAFLPGEEASMLVIMDGSSYVSLPASQDHKRAYDGDQGPNTGGMGAYCPAPIVTSEVSEKIHRRILQPMHDHLASQPTPYRGVLFVGLMIDEHDDPYVVEFNVRFGDPECQVTLPLIKTDLYEILHGAANDRLKDVKVDFHHASALTVVLASEGYPASPIKGRTIQGLEAGMGRMNYGSSWINIAGVSMSEKDTYIASGGRVLACTGLATSLGEAHEIAYAILSTLELEGGHYRRDIGFRAISGANGI